MEKLAPSCTVGDVYAHTPANKQVWFILNETLQLNAVVLQSLLSFHAVAAEQAELHEYQRCGRDTRHLRVHACRLPHSVELHLDATVQRRAAELKL